MIASKILDAVKENETFLISTHKSPDGDAIGSSIALGLALKKMNKTVYYAFEHPGPLKFNFINELCEVNASYKNKTFDVGFFVDTSDIDHLYDPSLLEKCKYTINIDHHISNAGYGHLNYIDVNASATSEIIYELLEYFKTPVDSEMAIAIYTAIVTDTGNFKYSNVTYKTHEIAGKLYKIPNHYWDINRKLFDEISYSRTKLLGVALNKLYTVRNGKVAIIFLSSEELNKFGEDTEMEGIINYARDISGVEVAVLIRETGHETYKLSFRSNGDFDVSALAVKYGGGGHSKAAGCTIKGKEVDVMLKELEEHIEI
ncbi:MAG: bifunctional oligoribonuclease/PAP phosphatase NrnA [Eubacteriaceae bacterium]|nr:bifunctional oligoribonuclease/PAP phosphatase NrnA [Eubacteriaceae bacterium]